MGKSFYWDEIDVRRRIIISKKRGILDPKVINYFDSLIRQTFVPFSSSSDKIFLDKPDVVQDCWIRLLETWMGFNEKKYDKTLPYFSEIVKRQIYMSNIILADGDKRGYIPKIISIDQIFSNMNDD